MRRRKLQKKCNSENATLEVAFFRIFRCICFGAVAFLFAFFRFFFVKKIHKLIKIAKKKQRRKCNVASCKKNATEKMQRWKLHFFAFSVPLFLAFAFSVALLDFPDLLQLALWFCLEFSLQRMLLIEGGTATSLGAKDTSLRNCLAHCMSRFLLGNFKIRDVKLDKIVAFWGCIFLVFFPACQVRVVRFCQSCSPPPPPRLAVLLLLLVLLLLPL